MYNKIEKICPRIERLRMNERKEKIINSILTHRLIVIVRGVSSEQLIPLAEALYRGGVRLLEVTYCADRSRLDEEVAEDIRLLCEHFEDRMEIGAGTVLTEKQVELTHRAGGQFIISPEANDAVIHRTVELGMVSIPGALTPREVQLANAAGADFVKLFPVDTMGSPYVKAIRAPLSHVRLLAVGGINENNLQEYLSAGVIGVGVGGNLVDKKCLANNDFSAIEQLARSYVERIKEWETI